MKIGWINNLISILISPFYTHSKNILFCPTWSNSQIEMFGKKSSISWVFLIGFQLENRYLSQFWHSSLDFLGEAFIIDALLPDPWGVESPAKLKSFVKGGKIFYWGHRSSNPLGGLIIIIVISTLKLTGSGVQSVTWLEVLGIIRGGFSIPSHFKGHITLTFLTKELRSIVKMRAINDQNSS